MIKKHDLSILEKSNIQPAFYIHTFGCQMNTADSQQIVELLVGLGLRQVDDYQQAQLIILNSCSVRQAAEDKVYGWGAKIRDQRQALALGKLTTHNSIPRTQNLGVGHVIRHGKRWGTRNSGVRGQRQR